MPTPDASQRGGQFEEQSGTDPAHQHWQELFDRYAGDMGDHLFF
jgi:hypothetical protein